MPTKRKNSLADDDTRPVSKRTKPGLRAHAKQLMDLMTETDMAYTTADEDKYTQVIEWSQREADKRLDADADYTERAI
ncbi:unnamed protein product [Penicillium roqueforti FM164]|uniref:Uncharacterized protein n=1 Tax=Penicillium roqueforti (strain FM164) TaxID=1365484 RepID=W6QLP9_PENRF|nr:unnamed protein product [Penicillium roqueforti FM164]